MSFFGYNSEPTAEQAETTTANVETIVDASQTAPSSEQAAVDVEQMTSTLDPTSSWDFTGATAEASASVGVGEGTATMLNESEQAEAAAFSASSSAFPSSSSSSSSESLQVSRHYDPTTTCTPSATCAQPANNAAKVISDLEVVFNVLKIALYFGTLLVCVGPVINDAAVKPLRSLVDAGEDEANEQISEIELDAMVDEQDEEEALAAEKEEEEGGEKKKNKKKKSNSVGRFQRMKTSLSRSLDTVKQRMLHSISVLAVVAVACSCVFTTWTYIIQFMVDDRAQYASLRQWIVLSDFITLAYQLVATTAAQWFWSSQLLYFVVPMTLFLIIEFARSPRTQRFEVLSTLWTGCGIAISFCFPLALSAIASSWKSHPEPSARYSVPFRWIILLPLVVAFVCVLLIPTAKTPEAFGLVLGLLHLGVVLPAAVTQFFPALVSERSQQSVIVAEHLVEHQKQLAGASQDGDDDDDDENRKKKTSLLTSEQDKLVENRMIRLLQKQHQKVASPEVQREFRNRTSSSLWIPITFFSFSIACAAMHVMNFMHVINRVSADRIFSSLFSAFCANSCQCSISLDVLQCSLIVVGFIWLMCPLEGASSSTSRGSGVGGLKWGEKMALTCLTPCLSLGFAFSAAVAICELRTLQNRLSSKMDSLFPIVSPSSTSKSTSHAVSPSRSRVAAATAASSKTTNSSPSFFLAKSNNNNNNNTPQKQKYSKSLVITPVAQFAKNNKPLSSDELDFTLNDDKYNSLASLSTSQHRNSKQPQHKIAPFKPKENATSSQQQQQKPVTKKRPSLEDTISPDASSSSDHEKEEQEEEEEAEELESPKFAPRSKTSNNSNNKTESNVSNDGETTRSSGISGCFSEQDDENEEEEKKEEKSQERQGEKEGESQDETEEGEGAKDDDEEEREGSDSDESIDQSPRLAAKEKRGWFW